MKLYEYQEKPHDQCVEIIKQYGVCYLAAEIRSGKTFMSLHVMNTLGKKHVLFVTKKKAMSSIQKDYGSGSFGYKLTLINFESVHTIDTSDVDGVIGDEMSSCGAYPKPSKRTKKLKEIVGSKDLLMMSGTPNAESYSQLYHQFYVHSNSPWKDYKNFYSWANAGYVFKWTRPINGFQINMYNKGNEEKIMADVNKYMVKLSQADAGFECEVKESFVRLKMKPEVYALIDRLKKDKVADMNGKEILCDSPAKARIKFRQIFGGTVITEDKSAHVIDTTKIDYVKNKYQGQKVAIYYFFDKEGELLRNAFPNHTDDQIAFNERSDLVFICQMKAGAMGIGLKTAEKLVLISVDDSATVYFQLRGRLQDKTRTTPAHVEWVFSKGGIEDLIYKNVSRKKNYTNKYFIKDFGMEFS